MSWKRHFRGNHTETAMFLFKYLKKHYPHCYFVTEETIKTCGQGGFIVDFLFKEVNLIVEVDGEAVHNHSDIQRVKTIRKKEALESIGYKVLNFTNDEVRYSIDKVAHAIESHYLAVERGRS